MVCHDMANQTITRTVLQQLEYGEEILTYIRVGLYMGSSIARMWFNLLSVPVLCIRMANVVPYPSSSLVQLLRT